MCAVNNCKRLAEHKGWCGMHYQRQLKYGDPLITKVVRHGMRRTPTYYSWQSMWERYRRKGYAERGITIDPRWASFSNFLADMGERPDDRTLDRINNNGNYEPTNCRWATAAEQARNRRDNIWVTLNGKTATLFYWTQFYGLHKSTVYRQYHRGISPEVIFSL